VYAVRAIRSQEDAIRLAGAVGAVSPSWFAKSGLPQAVATLPRLEEFTAAQVRLTPELAKRLDDLREQVRVVHGASGYVGDIHGMTGIPRGPILAVEQQLTAFVECAVAFRRDRNRLEARVRDAWPLLTLQRPPAHLSESNVLQLLILAGRYRAQYDLDQLARRVPARVSKAARTIIDELAPLVPETLHTMLAFGVLFTDVERRNGRTVQAVTEGT
jgi:hypothetical protein